MDFDAQAALRSLPLLIQGAQLTVIICAASVAIGAGIGMLACFGKMTERGPLFWLSTTFIDIFRTLPEMVLIFWVYSCAPILFGLNLSAMATGILVLSLYSAAYLAEIFRAGIAAVPRGQMEAALSLGIPSFWIWVSIMLPQAFRIMIPPFVNFSTELVKISALLSAIGVAELFYFARIASAENYRYFELFTMAGIMYFAILFPLSLVARYAERRLAEAK